MTNQAAEAESPFMTPHEYAAYVRRHPRTIVRWRHSGHGPQPEIDALGKPRYRRALVEAWDWARNQPGNGAGGSR